ncbi:carbon-nitrogen hydrolase family protein [Neptunomonas phycophila]|jgi:predicted amidohydrolase/GNAT superfamily N-acetyltransferase|uniref:Carbon-nitrogen hydrolase family protein n=1 Tax=Neptunomonas phycophila TaxID=1572645 RepID=A0AAW7XCS4_9GAMM|nr:MULTISPECIES: carbon-nitrogen hydrolase family protein [Neptunomonas]MBT3146381.1 bifunctional GNAT family N-acetyltransferase/carbon-nitrogen hydrolase family protein [Neptunomonas phycophila]MDN2659443.1 carbon-nitrogen hydrolase family protein [Neptunomonas sp. CHC150]MDO6451986.1 carbon-nitrogen hydrolase family protein [Neptunomonas phycophila]MDO6466542.1 carbon-nitrogen hydrolase family protein [Neptunomonas phycophila]MDO6785747.1 carbon-nitrogen hydrolase family protein [Neptunomon
MLEDLHLKIRNLEKSDYPQLKELMDSIYDDIGGAWPEHTIFKLMEDLPEGQICLVDHDQIVGVALSVQVNYLRFSNPHTYDDLISAKETILNNPDGDALYGLDVLIHKDYRGYRLGRRLYEARKELCRQHNLRAILAGGRIPNYYQYADEMTPVEYIEAVDHKRIYDPILTFQLSNDFQVTRLLKQYLPEDEKSQGYATLLEWRNIFFEPEGSVLESRKTLIRIGAIQWQMREVESVEEMLKQVEYFIDALSSYKSDFALFPEFFNAPLMGLSPDQRNQTEAIRFVASFTELFKNEMSQMAVSYNINVITGSLPLVEDDQLYNVSYLCRRDGTIEVQSKIHITPHERRDWVIQGGNEVRVFDTDAGRVGILICYDVEFPELGRILAEQDMDILFVPFWTDTKNGYLRVRHCAQARAIENECYVVICGSCGNLPQVENLDVQYSQAAVFSPSDFSFPHDAVMAETTPNTEMIMFSDLDLDKLKLVRSEGSVNNLKDRRTDLYSLAWKNKTL